MAESSRRHLENQTEEKSGFIITNENRNSIEELTLTEGNDLLFSPGQLDNDWKLSLDLDVEAKEIVFSAQLAWDTWLAIGLFSDDISESELIFWLSGRQEVTEKQYEIEYKVYDRQSYRGYLFDFRE